jgi:transposase-like protein
VNEDAAGGRSRQLPVFHCPYCGDEELSPYEAPTGSSPAAGWLCGACLRAFTVRLIATGVHPA